MPASEALCLEVGLTTLGQPRLSEGAQPYPRRRSLARLPPCYGITAMQHYGMTYTLPISKRGTLTLPPELRRRLKLDQVASPLVIVEERDGGLFLQSAVAMPIRDIPKATIRQWVLNDEAEAKDLKAFRRKK